MLWHLDRWCHVTFGAVTSCSHRGHQLSSQVTRASEMGPRHQLPITITGGSPEQSGRGFRQTATLQDSEPINSLFSHRHHVAMPTAAATGTGPQTAHQTQRDQQAAGRSRPPETPPGPGLPGPGPAPRASEMVPGAQHQLPLTIHRQSQLWSC